KFRGKEVLVIGGGQSALETAALLSEAGAYVEVLVRNSKVHWLGRHQWMSSKRLAWMFYGRGGIGPAGVSLAIQRPDLFRRYPRLDAGLESSLSGLHFLGAPAAWSFGPLMKFVAGTEFSSNALRERILETSGPVRLAPYRQVPARLPQTRRPAANIAVSETRA